MALHCGTTAAETATVAVQAFLFHALKLLTGLQPGLLAAALRDGFRLIFSEFRGFRRFGCRRILAYCYAKTLRQVHELAWPINLRFVEHRGFVVAEGD